MKFKKVRISKDATHRLKMLKGRTGLTPNLLCRMAFCHSIEDPRVPNPESYDAEGQEFNRYTLTGEYDAMFAALLKERCDTDGIEDEDEQERYFVAHINRGVSAITSKVKSVADLVELVPRTRKSA